MQAHGFVERMSKDVDLFTTMSAVANFPTAQAEVMAALRVEGLDVRPARGVRPARRQCPTILELGADWRAHPPVTLAVGPVLHPADAAANKVCALFGRAEVRDYVDVHGVLADGRFSGDELLRMAAEHDPGFDRGMFAEARRAVRRFPASAFEPYKLTSDDVDALTARLLGWAEEIEPAAP